MDVLYDKTRLSARQWLIDIGIAVAAFLYSWLHLVLSSNVVVMQDTAFRQLVGYLSANPTPAMVVAFALMAVPLVVRRIFPIPVTLIVFIMYVVLVQAVGDYGVSIISPAIALFSIAEKGDLKVSLVSTAILIAVVLGMEAPFINAHLMWILQVQNISVLAVAMAFGIAISTYRRYIVEVKARAQADAEAREEETKRRISQERIAIAREVHDITAHSLTAVNLQATAAERLIDKDPQTAKQAIQQVRSTSKEALTQIRQLVHGLRENDEPAEMAPTSGTEALDSLITFAAQAHVDVSIDRTNYKKSEVPSYVDVVLFDIAREAMTNIIRHAHAVHAHIKLGISANHAYITISDDGEGVAQEDDMHSHGNGLVGMAERARILNGTLYAGNRPEGGFVVHAEIPVEKGKNEA